LALDEETIQGLTRNRYWSAVHRARADGKETNTLAGRFLLSHTVASLSEVITLWCEKACKGAGRKHGCLPQMRLLEPSIAALIVSKIVLDGVATVRSRTEIATEVGRRMEDEYRFRLLKKHKPKYWKTILRDRRHANEAHLTKILTTLCLKEAGAISYKSWSKVQRARVGLLLIELLISSTGLVEMERRPKTRGKKIRMQSFLVPAEDTLDWLEKSHEHHQALAPFYLPMTTPPLDWSDTDRGGYEGDVISRYPLVRLRHADNDKLLDEDMPMVYDAVNTLQKTGWRVNRKVYDVFLQLWEEGGGGVLPSRNSEPLPEKPEDIGTNESALADWKRQAAPIHERNGVVKAQRLRTLKMAFVAKEVSENEKIYFPYQLDFRGRAYCVPQFFNPQGPDLARGLLEFSDGHIATDSRYLFHWAANCFGVKGTFTEREAWVESNMAQILAVVRDPLEQRFWVEADDAWQFLACCFAIDDFRNARPLHLPVHIDGTNNGLQIYALILGDERLAKMTGCTRSDVPADAYMSAFAHLQDKLSTMGERMADRWLVFFQGIGPKKCRTLMKRPLMTLAFGLTSWALRDQLDKWFNDLCRDDAADPWDMSIRRDALDLLSEAVWQVIQRYAGKALGAMDWLQEVSQAALETSAVLSWKSPSGFRVIQDYRKREKRQIQLVLGECVRNMTLRLDNDEPSWLDHKKAVCPNFVHSLDAAALMETVCRMSALGCTSFAAVHDSYAVHPHLVGHLHAEVRQAFHGLALTNPLKSFQEEVLELAPGADRVPCLLPKGAYQSSELQTAAYFFH